MKKFHSKNIIYISLCSLLIITAIPLYSQNLVPNSSFEEFIDFENAKSNGWHKIQISDTPDYFNLGSKNPHNSIFEEYIGRVKPKSGDSFIGIFCLRIDPVRNIKNIREYIGTPLIDTLEKDSIYKVEISLLLDEESNTAIKNFGLLFSETTKQFGREFKLFSLKPQLQYDSSYLQSMDKWMVLQFYYKAKGFENFLCLGNFSPDKSTKILNIVRTKLKGKEEKWGLTKKELAAYYYIDDVIIEKITVYNKDPLIIIDVKADEEEPVFNIDEIKTDSAIILKNIVFDFNKSELLPQSYKEADKLFALMNSNPEIRVKLEGHTDNIGTYDFNLKLSVDRVISVKNYLVGKGIDPGRIEYIGNSFSSPLESNDTEEGRAINRRVTFKIIQK